MIKKLWCLAVALFFAMSPSGVARADCLYERAGWTAELTTLFHGVSGTATIIDERTVHLENFTYDGGGPAVYAYLGATDTHQAYLNGLPVPPLLSGQVFTDESLTLTLPPGETLDDFGAISIWCADVNVNFGSGSFEPPPGALYARAGWTAELSTLFHDVAGAVTIINQRILMVEQFTYDGGGPAVYFYLGARNSNADFSSGLPLDPLLTGRAFANQSLVLTLSAGQTLDGYGAISVWCAAVGVNFGSGTFEQSPMPGDVDGNCRVDIEDYTSFEDCLAGVDTPPDPSGSTTVQTCLEVFDFDVDGDLDLRDLAALQTAFTGA